MSDEQKRIRIISDARMKPLEYMRQHWGVDAEEGTSIEDVLKDVYWSHMAPQMHAGDRIEVTVETGEWMLDLLVMQVDRGWARVHVLHRYDLVGNDAVPQTRASGIDAQFKGKYKKWCAIRLSDGHYLQEQLPTREAAEDWIRNYETALA